MRAGITAIPNGSYKFTDLFESNQFPAILELSVEIKVQDDAMALIFDAPPQVRAGLNMVYTALLASCYYAVKSAIDPTILPNSGLSRPLTVSAPEGSILNCVHPAAVDGRIAASQRVADIILGALSKAMPGKISAAGNGCCTGATFSGTRKNGDIWVYLETIGGGGGARPTSDGLSGIQVHMTNTSNLPVEGLELEFPLTLMRYELVDDSAGVGKFRGGQGIRRVYRVEEACRLSLDTSRLRSQPWGLNGGENGQATSLDFGDGRNDFAGMIDLKPGQIIEIATAGGGGFGTINERSPDSVQRDLAEGRKTA
jgi:N-methylhydantoinase B